MNRYNKILCVLCISLLPVLPAFGNSFSYTTGAPDGKIGIASQPAGPNDGNVENETGDDFILSQSTNLTSATFTGLVPAGYSVSNLDVEVYHVFPADSTNPPNGQVPTRVNSPADVELLDRSTGAGTLTFTATVLNPNFTAANSILNGIHPIPNQKTGGEGPITGEEVLFTVNFTNPIDLPADHYFFVPQVGLASGNFFWLSAPFPNTIDPINPDLQVWTRNSGLDPNWLRAGTDIVGGTKFNASFSLTGTPTPEPGSLLLLGSGLLGVASGIRKRGRRA